MIERSKDVPLEVAHLLVAPGGGFIVEVEKRVDGGYVDYVARLASLDGEPHRRDVVFMSAVGTTKKSARNRLYARIVARVLLRAVGAKSVTVRWGSDVEETVRRRP